MEIKLVRKIFKEDRTLSDLYINGELFCQVLEDTDRGLDSSWSLEDIKKVKIHGKTCIPYGKYSVAISYSNRFKRLLPILLNVPGYLGIRIHPGNKPEDTEGCILPGVQKEFIVINSVITFNKLNKIITNAIKKEKVTFEIVKEAAS